MIILFIILWLLSGVLAFRLYCRSEELYEFYEDYSFDGFFIIMLAGGFSLLAVLILLCSEKKLVPYKTRKKFYELIVGKDNKGK